MNQGKLEVVKQEMARVNNNTLGVSKLDGVEQMNLTQMTIISTAVGTNPSEDMEYGEGNGNPLQYPCLENPMGREAWWATVHRVTNRHD